MALNAEPDPYERARGMRREMLTSLAMFRESEQRYDAIVQAYLDKMINIVGGEDRLSGKLREDANQQAQADNRLKVASARCKYFGARARTFALAFQVEMLYQEKLNQD